MKQYNGVVREAIGEEPCDLFMTVAERTWRQQQGVSCITGDKSKELELEERKVKVAASISASH